MILSSIERTGKRRGIWDQIQLLASRNDITTTWGLYKLIKVAFRHGFLFILDDCFKIS